MKKIKNPIFIGELNRPDPEPVEVVKFEPPASPPSVGIAPSVDESLPLPPAPAQLNAPVGPPPPPRVLPTDFEGYVELAKMVSRGEKTDKAMIWVGLAQAVALNTIAERLDELCALVYTGVDENGEEVTSVLTDVIANGIAKAAAQMPQSKGGKLFKPLKNS